MKITTGIGIILLGVSLTGPLAAADSKVGTSGAQFLKIGAGARATALGDAFVGVADDVNAVYFNPAGLAGLDRPEFTAMHTQYFQDMNYDFGAFSFPAKIGAFGISVATLKVEDLQKRGADESLQGNFESLDAAYGLSYARNVNRNLLFGITARLVQQEIDQASAQTWSGDLGFLKKFSASPMTVGFAVRHFGQGVEFRDESDPLPLTIDLGIGLPVLQKRLLLAADVRQPRDNGVQFGIGGEFRGALVDDTYRYAIRAGYNSAVTDADSANGLAVGAGLAFRQFGFDFAWVPLGDLGDTFRYAAHFRF